MTDILPRRGDLDAQPFTYEHLLKMRDALYDVDLRGPGMYIVHPDEARRLRAEWDLKVRKFYAEDEDLTE